MRRIILGSLVLLVLLGAGYSFTRENAGAAYITAPVEKGTIITSVKATGSVEPVITVEVSSQLSGRISEVFVNFNDQVKVAQPIARVDPEIFEARVNEAKAALKVAQATALVQEAAVERARAAIANAQLAHKMAEAQTAGTQVRLDQAEKELQRKLQLIYSGSVTDRDRLQAQTQRDMSAAELRAAVEDRNMKHEAINISTAELRMAEANVQNAQAVVEQRQATLEQAKLDLDRTLIRAPIDGVIIKRDVNPGQTVAVTLEAKTLFKIAQDLREMEVRGKIDEADVGRLQVGQTARFSVDAFPDRAFEGRVLQVRKAPEIVQNVVTYTVIVSARNPDLLLLPGMTAVLRVLVSDTGEVLKIPNQALRFRPGPASFRREESTHTLTTAEARNGTVWVLANDGSPSAVPVTLGASDENSTHLVSGPVHEGDQLIVGTAAPQTGSGLLGLRLGF